MIDDIHSGDIVAYHRRPEQPLMVVGEPFEFDGRLVVTARTCEKSKKNQHHGLYAIEALRLVPQTEKSPVLAHRR